MVKDFLGKIWEIPVALVVNGIAAYLLGPLDFPAMLDTLGQHRVEAIMLLIFIIVLVVAISSTIARAVIRFRVRKRSEDFEKLNGTIECLQSKKAAKDWELEQIEASIRSKKLENSDLKDEENQINLRIVQKEDRVNFLDEEIAKSSKRLDELKSQNMVQLVGNVVMQNNVTIISSYNDAAPSRSCAPESTDDAG